MRQTDRLPLWRPLVLSGLITVLAGLLLWALWSLPPQAEGLSSVVRERLPESGVSAEVTAVLLNFRGYDTLLEMAVLLAALLGAWNLGPQQLGREDLPMGPVLHGLLRYLAPMMVLVSGYLLWLGGHTAGGAFQAGALLAAAAVLVLVSRPGSLALRDRTGLRLLAVAGLAMFVAVAGGVMLAGGALLQYPPSQAGSLILLIESASSLAIGLTLALLFTGGRPSPGGSR